MKKEGRAGLTRIVMSQKERAILLVAQDKGLVAYGVHEAEDLISMNDVMPQKTDAPAPEMVKIALQLIDQKSGEFDVSDFIDQYGVRLRKLLDAKLAGEELPAIEAPKTNVINLMSALRKVWLGRKFQQRQKQTIRKQPKPLNTGRLKKRELSYALAPFWCRFIVQRS